MLTSFKNTVKLMYLIQILRVKNLSILTLSPNPSPGKRARGDLRTLAVERHVS